MEEDALITNGTPRGYLWICFFYHFTESIRESLKKLIFDGIKTKNLFFHGNRSLNKRAEISLIKEFEGLTNKNTIPFSSKYTPQTTDHTLARHFERYSG